jgi:hypothetical protein
MLAEPSISDVIGFLVNCTPEAVAQAGVRVVGHISMAFAFLPSFLPFSPVPMRCASRTTSPRQGCWNERTRQSSRSRDQAQESTTCTTRKLRLGVCSPSTCYNEPLISAAPLITSSPTSRHPRRVRAARQSDCLGTMKKYKMAGRVCKDVLCTCQHLTLCNTPSSSASPLQADTFGSPGVDRL